MRRTAICILMALWGAAGAAQAQTVEEGAQERPARPVFSLPPGDPVEEQPDPTVQGPRIPGMAAPRAIDPDAPREQQQRPDRQTQSRSQPTPTRPQDAPAREAQASQAPAPQGRQPARQTAQSALPSLPANSAGAQPSGEAMAAIAGDVTGDETLFDIGPERVPDASASAADPTLAPAADAKPGFPPLWLTGLALLLAAGLGYLVWKRRAAPAPETGIAVIPDRATAPAPDAEPLAAAPAAEPPAPQIELDFEPLEARWSEAGLAIKFRLYLRNISDQPVRDIAVHLGIRSADRNLGPSQGPAGLPNLFLETLEAHDLSAHEGEMRLDDKAIQPVMVEGREMVLPVVDIMPRYRDSADNMRKIQVALLVGRERDPPARKLAPLAVRTALGPSERLGCRMIALPGAPRPAAVA